VAVESVDHLQETNRHEITMNCEFDIRSEIEYYVFLTCPEIASTTSQYVLSPTTSASLQSGLSGIC
jgi:hypothetical protein